MKKKVETLVVKSQPIDSPLTQILIFYLSQTSLRKLCVKGIAGGQTIYSTACFLYSKTQKVRTVSETIHLQKNVPKQTEKKETTERNRSTIPFRPKFSFYPAFKVIFSATLRRSRRIRGIPRAQRCHFDSSIRTDRGERHCNFRQNLRKKTIEKT